VGRGKIVGPRRGPWQDCWPPPWAVAGLISNRQKATYMKQESKGKQDEAVKQAAKNFCFVSIFCAYEAVKQAAKNFCFVSIFWRRTDKGHAAALKEP
jgi:hypothetical protein